MPRSWRTRATRVLILKDGRICSTVVAPLDAHRLTELVNTSESCMTLDHSLPTTETTLVTSPAADVPTSPPTRSAPAPGAGGPRR